MSEGSGVEGRGHRESRDLACDLARAFVPVTLLYISLMRVSVG